MKILIIDNYDSFTYNLVQLIGNYTSDIIVKRNDQVTLSEITEINPDKILISPGPGKPEESSISLKVIKYFHKTMPILGVCLGHQCIGIAFGGRVIKNPYPKHGKLVNITHDNQSIYKGLPNTIKVSLYHSLMIDEHSFPEDLGISAKSDDGLIMGVRHKKYPLEGVQFHPEAILTDHGDKMLKTWIFS